MIRTFLALELPAPLRARLSQLESEFAEYARVLKWTAPNLLHITLRFLGGVPESRLALVIEAAREAAERSQPLRLSLSEPGAFPTTRKPRVIWGGLQHDEEYRSLEGLFSRVEAALTARGFPPEERPFAPHITLARTRDTIAEPARRELGTALASVAARTTIEASFPVDEVTVMRSDLGPAGPRYTPLARCPLSLARASEQTPTGGR